MLSFTRQTDINYFQGDLSQLGHRQGPREKHPDGVEYLGLYLYVLCLFFKTHQYKRCKKFKVYPSAVFYHEYLHLI